MKAFAPPSSKESEMMVLGCMINSNTSLNTCADQLDLSNFYYEEHQSIFEILKECSLHNKPADVHILSEKLKNKKQLTTIGGITYLTTLSNYSGTSAYVEEYIEIVKEKYILRKMWEASKQIEMLALKSQENVSSRLDHAQRILFEIGRMSGCSMGQSLSEFIGTSKFLTDVQQRQEDFINTGKSKSTGINTGFVDLDKLLNGMSPGNLIILASRPSMGKTALSLSIADHLAIKGSIPSAIFSLEMTTEEIMYRLVSMNAEVESNKIKSGSISGREYQSIVTATKNMEKGTLIIDDQPGMKISDLHSKARRIKEIYDIEFLIIDYIQLLSGSKGYYGSENRQNEISEISRTLKNLARELKIPILCLSQLSRKVEERMGHIPMLSDIRESGSIEQDADMVIFVYRPDYYDPTDKPGLAEIIVGKNRNGQVGNVKLVFRKEYAQFNNYSCSN